MQQLPSPVHARPHPLPLALLLLVDCFKVNHGASMGYNPVNSCFLWKAAVPLARDSELTLVHPNCKWREWCYQEIQWPPVIPEEKKKRRGGSLKLCSSGADMFGLDAKMPGFHIGVSGIDPGSSSCSSFLLMQLLGGSGHGLSTWIPATCMGNLDFDPTFWLWL